MKVFMAKNHCYMARSFGVCGLVGSGKVGVGVIDCKLGVRDEDADSDGCGGVFELCGA